MGSRLHGNDGGRRRTSTRQGGSAPPHGGRRRTHIVIPATAGNPRAGGELRWVPVYTGTTVGDGAPHTAGGSAPTSSFPRRRESTAGEPAMGSRLHGNDGGRRRTPHGGRQRAHIVIPATAGIHGGGSLRWVPVYTGTTVGDGAPTSSFPRRRESTWGGEPAMGSRLHGNDGGRRRAHIVIPATAGIQGGGSLRWVPVYTGTTVGDGAPHIVIPATVGGSAPTSLFPRRRESTWGGEPAMGSRLHGNDGGRRRTPHGRRRRAHIVIPATAGIHGGGRQRWVPVYTGTTVGRRRTSHGRRRRAHIVIPATAGGGAPTSSFPPRRESTWGGLRWVPVYTGTTVGRRRTSTR